MHLPVRKAVSHWPLAIGNKELKTKAQSLKAKAAFTLIELLVARHPKLSWDSKLQRSVQRRKAAFGFTLIELLVVISIIGILLSVATVSFLNAQQKGRDNKRKTDLKAVQQALEIYYNQNGKYPFKRDDSDTANGRMACVNTASTGVKWGDAFACSLITYMNPTPKDPVFPATTTQANEKDYYYESNNSSTPANQTYILSARLENTNDLDFKGNPNTNITNCTPEGYTNSATFRRNYCVVNP